MFYVGYFGLITNTCEWVSVDIYRFVLNNHGPSAYREWTYVVYLHPDNIHT